jgi:gluconolactonase
MEHLNMIFASDLGNPEGPVLLDDGSWVLVEMHPERGCLTHISADGRSRHTIVKTGRPNGVTLDRDGYLWVAESVNPPSLLRVTLEGQIETILTACDGELFLWPNDLRFGPDGALYMTDSGISQPLTLSMTPDERAAARENGKVFRIDVTTRQISLLDEGLRFANGIAFGPDDDLYVNETSTGLIYRYAWQGGKVGARQTFCSVRDPNKTGLRRGPDGMAFGLDGNLYCTVSRQGDVTVVSPEGRVIERIQLDGPSPTNIAFGAPGERRIYVTEQGIGQFEVHPVGTDGLPLYR